MTIKRTLRSIILATIGLSTFATSQVLANEQHCDTDETIVFAGLDWDSASFHTEVARLILEKGYNCKTDRIPGSTVPMLNGLIRGNIDVMMELWKDNVKEAWRKAEEKNKVVDLGSNFNDAVQGWFIPKYMVEGANAPAKGLKSVFDLPKYKHLFRDPEQPEKGRFYNCIAGWNCENVNRKKLAVYGLNEHFVNFRPGTGAALGAAVESNMKRKKPVLFYYWGPSWVMGKYGDQMVMLEEPPYDLATWDEMSENDEPTVATAYPIVDVRIGVNKKFINNSPNIAKFLKNYQTTSAQVSKMLDYMRLNDASVEEAAVYFLENNEAIWTQWVPSDIVKHVKAKL